MSYISVVIRLTKLQDYYKDKKPTKLDEKSYAFQRFLIFHANDKVERNLTTDPESALLAMHFGIKDLLPIHYGVHGHWWLSDKRLSADLDTWDSKLAQLLKNFIALFDPTEKFKLWSQIVDHILEPIGGHKDIFEHDNISDISARGLKNIEE